MSALPSLCYCGRYGDSYKWTTDGSCHLQHLLVVDTTASSLQQQVARVLEFLGSLEEGDSTAATAAASAAAPAAAAAASAAAPPGVKATALHR
jgi:hypothetical protein